MKTGRPHTVLTVPAPPAAGIGVYVELFKLHLCLYIALSAIFGYVTAAGTFNIRAMGIGLFVCVLAVGAAVLNNYQDREYDRFFIRTCNRGLPSGRILPVHALFIACLLIVTGLAGIWMTAGHLPFLLGMGALIAYNMLYTPLKKKTLLSMVPGSLCGMLVPAIGWTAAGGRLQDPVLPVVMAVFGLWQMAHFFIILVKTRHRMIHHPGAKRFANFFTLFSDNEIKLQTMIWTSLYTLSMLWFMLVNPSGHAALDRVLLANAFAVWLLVSWIITRSKPAASLAFAGINLSMLVFMGSGIVNALLP